MPYADPMGVSGRRDVMKTGRTCGTCGRRYANPFTHTCTVKTDYKKRKRQQVRKAATAERRKRRKAAAARRKAAAKARKSAARTRPRRPRPPAHDYRTCRDQECERYGCRAYRQGIEDCPLSHGGD